jgi:hypothetical protein
MEPGASAMIIVGRAIVPADTFSNGSGRLKGGCSHEWPPHNEII